MGAAGPEHVYARIEAALRREILAGRYEPGTRLPTHSELCLRFNASRNSVREALRKLQGDGLVSSRQGSGTTVEKPSGAVYLHSVDSVDELVHWSHETEYRIEGVAMQRADARLARKLHCSAGRSWLHLQGFRFGGDPLQAVCWTETFIHHAYAGLRNRIQQHRGPIYHMIEREFDEVLVEVQQSVRAVPIPARQASVLGVEPGSPGLEMERIYRTANNRVAEIAFSLHPGSRFTATITLRRGPRAEISR